jgi:phage-related protein
MRNLPRAIVFFATEAGTEPVREWLKSLPKEEKRIIGVDIKTVQWTPNWRKPLVGSLGHGLWEVRSTLSNTIARVLFFECGGEMILLHGFKKKTQRTPSDAINLATKRKTQYEQAQK